MPIVFENVTQGAPQEALAVFDECLPKALWADGAFYRLQTQLGALYLIRCDGCAVGVSIMGEADASCSQLSFDDGAQNACTITYLSLCERFRGTGLGTRALHAALFSLARSGYDAVRIKVPQADVPAMKLCQNAGFRICDTRLIHDVPHCLMSRSLAKETAMKEAAWMPKDTSAKDASRLFVRAATPLDAQELLSIYTPYVRETAVTFAYEPPTLREFRETIEKTLRRYPYIVALRDGRIEGYAYASSFHARAAYDWDCELSIYVRRDARACGVGGVLYDQMEKLLRAQGLFNMYACIAHTRIPDAHLTNASRAFHAHRGFTLVADLEACGYKFGRWYDMIWMHKALLPAPPVPPSPILRFDQVREAFGLTDGQMREA